MVRKFTDQSETCQAVFAAILRLRPKLFAAAYLRVEPIFCQWKNGGLLEMAKTKRRSRADLAHGALHRRDEQEKAMGRAFAKFTRGDEIRFYRKLLGLTQGELAEKADVNVETIVRIEKGKNVQLDTLERVRAAVVGTPVPDEQSDLPRHGEDQTSDPERGSSDVTAGTVEARIQELEHKVAQQEDLINRLESAARGLVRMFATTPEAGTTLPTKSGSARAGRKAG